MAKNPKPLRKRKRGYMSVNETKTFIDAMNRWAEMYASMARKKEEK